MLLLSLWKIYKWKIVNMFMVVWYGEYVSIGNKIRINYSNT